MTFRLKTLFIAVTVAAILLAIFFALPLKVSIFVCGAISVVAPAGFVAWIVYGRGYGRAFAIGCTAAAAIMLFSMGLQFLLFNEWMATGADVPGVPQVGSMWNPTSIALASNTGEKDYSVLAIVYTPYPMGFSLVVLSGFLSVLVRWLTLRERCLLE